MEHDKRLPGRETQSVLSERLEHIKNYLRFTSELLETQAITLRQARPLQSAALAAQRQAAFDSAADRCVEVASEALRELRYDIHDYLGLWSPHSENAYGKLHGISYSAEQLKYIGTVAVPGTDSKSWPIIDADQIFIDNRPYQMGPTNGFGGTTGRQVDLRMPPNSVVLDYGTNYWRL